MTKGQRIKIKRESLNISQTDLAKKCDISKQTLYKYENDIVTNIPSDVIEKLASNLGCSPAYIMGWKDFESEEQFDFRMSDSDIVIECAQKLKKLPSEQVKIVLQYINFLSEKGDLQK